MLLRLIPRAGLILMVALLASCGAPAAVQLPTGDQAKADVVISNSGQPSTTDQSGQGEDSLTLPEQPTQKTGK